MLERFTEGGVSHGSEIRFKQEFERLRTVCGGNVWKTWEESEGVVCRAWRVDFPGSETPRGGELLTERV